MSRWLVVFLSAEHEFEISPNHRDAKNTKVAQREENDILVADSVVVEVKSVEALAPIHEAQLLTYLRIGGWRIGLLINFNVVVLKQGIRRRIMGFDS